MPEIFKQPLHGPNGTKVREEKIRYMAYNKLKSLENNISAIETALTVLSQKRKATPKERETLSLYSGFGGIKEMLNIGTWRSL